MFSKGSLYWPQTFVAIAGALLPIPIWWLGRRYPKRIFRRIDLVVMLNGVLAMPPTTGVNYASFLLVGFIFRKSTKSKGETISHRLTTDNNVVCTRRIRD